MDRKSESADAAGRAVELRAFLLGALDETDAERVEYSLLSDDRLYELLLATEEELIDEYLSGALSEREASSLLGYLDRLPDGRFRVGFGRELRQRFADLETTSTPNRRSAEKWRGLFSLRPAVAIAATFVSAVTLITYFAILQREPATIVLTAGLTRSEGEVPTVSHAAGGRAIRALLDLGSSSHDRYRATLYNDDGGAIATFEGLRATVTKRRIYVAIALPLAELPPADYSIGLEGDASGKWDPLGRYVVRVTE